MKGVEILFLHIFLKCILGVCFDEPNYPVFDPDVFRNASELIASKGYPVEEHQVITPDGYILSLQRIPGRQNGTSGNPAVLLHHGQTGLSTHFVFNLPNQSLGYILADAGYDVWLTNARGSTYSRRHVSLSPRKPQFWKFSWDEMALIDLPAIIDYILDTTGQESLFYVGHSMGGTVICALLADQPQYNAKVRVAVGMAPGVLLGHSKLPWISAEILARETKLLEHLGTGEVMADNFLSRMLTEVVCNVYAEQCDMWMLKSVNPKHFNDTRLPVYLATSPAGTSMRSVIHYGQLIVQNKFQKYDFGPTGNIKKYNQSTPPEYNLSAISAPVALMWGLDDQIVSPVDVNLLAQKLPNMVLNYPVLDPEWGHLEFVVAFDAYPLVYKEILKLFSRY